MSTTSKPEDDEALTRLKIKTDRKMLLKLDLLLVPMCCAIYLIAFLDRSNIGNARVAGLQKDLKLTDVEYQIAITLTYIPYMAGELPSNLMLKKIGPKIQLPIMMVLWGLTSTCQSQIKSYSGLLACRFFIGLFEGGLFPGLVLYLSGFYRPHELQIRVALFFCAAALSSAFSGLLAAAIERMEGLGGMHGWQWIFLLEGVFTILFALLAIWVLPNTPLEVKTLTPFERAYCQRRLELDAKGSESTKIIPRDIFGTLKDINLWILVLILFCNGASLFGLAYFTPSIVAGFGYSANKTQLYTVPPFTMAFVVTVIAALVSDKYRARGAVAFVTTSLSLAGFAVFYVSKTIAVRYVALHMLITGVYATAPCLIAWLSNNFAAHTRRATAVALGFMTTNLGGIVSTWLYPKSAAPKYKFAAKFNLALNCITLLGIVLNILVLRWRNRMKVEKREVILAGLEELDDKEQYEVLGDRHPDFKYTL